MTTLRSKYPDVSIPENTSVIDFVFEKFDYYGDSVAFVSSDTGQSYTFSQLKLTSLNIASALTRLGHKKGDVFGIMSPNIPDYVPMYFGIALIGGVNVGINYLYTEGELDHLLVEVGVKVLVAHPTYASKALAAKKRFPTIKDVFVFGKHEGCQTFDSLVRDNGDAFPDIEISPDDVFGLQFSSGTTGKAKPVILTNNSLLWNLVQIESHYPEFLDSNRDDVGLSLMPFHHLYGLLIMMIHWARKGTTSVTMMRFEREHFLETIQNYKITFLPIVPPLLLFLDNDPLVDSYDVSSVREVLNAAAPLGAELTAAIKKKFGSHIKIIRQAYGMTEAGPFTHFCPSSIDASSCGGLLLPNTEAKVIDTLTGDVLGPGEDGEICMRGPQIMVGYLNNPEATARTIDSEGWIHSGDIGHYDERELFYIVDRIKELIKYKGFQVPPAELEDLLITHPSISEAAVIGVPDKGAGELPRAYVVRTNQALTEDDVKAFVAEKVAPFKKLRGGVEFLSEIPKSASGKILRRILREKIK